MIQTRNASFMAGNENTLAGGRWLFWILFVVCPLLFFTDLTRNPYYTQIAILNIVICLYWLLSIVDGFRRGEWIWTSTTLDLPLFVLIGICFLSWFCSFFWHPNLRISIYSEGSRAIIFLIVNVFLAYAIAVRAQDRAFIQRWLWVFYATATFAAAYGVSQYFGWEWFWPHNLNPYGNRPVSTFGNPNFMSSFLAVILPILTADIAVRVSKLPRVLLAAAWFACMAALLATLTRSSWAGTLVGFFIVAPMVLKKAQDDSALRNWLIVMGSVTVLAIILWPKGPSNGYSTTVIERLAEVKQANEGTVAAASQRFLIWICSWQMVLDHPFLGTGWGCIELFYPFYQGAHLLDPIFNTLRTHANNAHNEILEYWSQVGTIGLGVVCWLWIVFFSSARSMARRLDREWKTFHWGLIGGVSAMLVDNLLNVSLHFAVPAFVFWWVVGTVFAVDPAARTVRRLSTSRPLVRAGLAVSALVLACFMVRAFCFWMEEVHFFAGFKSSKGGNLQAARDDLGAAYWWHALDVNNDYELANVYARMADKDHALPMYQRALDANAGYDEIYFNRATVYAETGKTDEAKWNYRMAIAINPLSHDAYNALGSIYLKDLERYGADVQALYEQATRAFPNDRDLWNNLGYVYTKRQEWQDAYRAYRRALEISPDFTLAWQNLRAISPHITGAKDDVFLKQGQIFPQAEQLMAARHFAEARQLLAPLEAAAPGSFRAHFDLGNAYFGLHDLDHAVAEFTAAAQLKGDSPSVWQNLGVAEEQAGKKDEARAAFEKVLQLDPKNEAVRQHLGQLH